VDRELKRLTVIITDIHMGEGLIVDDKRNPIEYFEDDNILYTAIAGITEKHRDVPITLVLNGDIFDFFTIKYKGKVQTKPTERVACYKILRILKGHPLFIKGLQKFLLANKDNKIVFIIGNHDIHLVFENVVNIIKSKIASEKKFDKNQIKEVKARISVQFTYQDEHVFCIHGNDSEPKNKTPNPLFLTDHNFQKLPKKYLNLPFGAYMTEYSSQLATGNWFCKGNYWIGRMEGHGYVFLETLFTPRKWHFAIHAISVLLRGPLYFRFAGRWWVRKNSSLWDLLKLVFDASFGIAYKVDGGVNYARKLMQDDPKIKTVFIGHEHCCRQIFFPEGKVIYPGNWSTTFEAHHPTVELKWRRFRWLEKIIKTIKLNFSIFNKKNREKYAPKRVNLFSFGVARFYSNGESDAEIMKFNPEKGIIEPL